MKRLLITGGSGDLGRVLCQRAVAMGHQVTATYLTRPERIRAGKPIALDLCDRDAVRAVLDAEKPEVVIHTAVPPPTMPNQRQQIVTAAYHLRHLCSSAVRLIFLSSDMVFDGTRAPYRDEAPPAPRSAYGQAKAEMEMVGDCVVRTSLIYDFEPGNKQVDWMLERIVKGERVRLFSDEHRSAIWSLNLADALLELVTRPINGLINVAGPESISRLELGWKILNLLGHDQEANIEAVSAAGSGRPTDLTLDISMARMVLKTPLLTVDEAIERWKTHKGL